MNPSAVLLDLDGTLFDTVLLHTVAWSQALEQVGITVPMSAIQPLIGMGGVEMLDELIGHDDPAARQAHAQFFGPLRPLARLLPGAEQLLTAVHRQGCRAFVVTTSSPADAEALLQRLSGAGIDGLVHGDDATRTMAAPDLFRAALDRWELEPEQTLAVGDAEWDVRSAGRAGVRSIGVLTGGTSAERLLAAGAAAVFRSCLEVADGWPEPER